jgi:lipoate-protein ligase B
VFTVGRTTQDQHWPGESCLTQESGIPVIRTERGGSITYHGPGQLIGYPVLRLSDFCAGPKAYVHRLEDVIISTLAEWGIAGHRRERLPGVWVGGDHPVENRLDRRAHFARRHDAWFRAECLPGSGAVFVTLSLVELPTAE